MRQVEIKYHLVRDPIDRFSFPGEELTLLYRSAGIHLNIEEGEQIKTDPARSALLPYQKLMTRYKNNDPFSGHIIIGLISPEKRTDIAGQLLDLESRGVAAVFVRSDYITRFRETGLLQTCAHEIGHMLNLAHEDVDPGATSAMHQAQQRGGDLLEIKAAWDAVAAKAAELNASGDSAYFNPLPKQIACYPFAHVARAHLNTCSSHRLLPWGSKFERPYGGSNDETRSGRRTGQQGEPGDEDT